MATKLETKLDNVEKRHNQRRITQKEWEDSFVRTGIYFGKESLKFAEKTFLFSVTAYGLIEGVRYLRNLFN